MEPASQFTSLTLAAESEHTCRLRDISRTRDHAHTSVNASRTYFVATDSQRRRLLPRYKVKMSRKLIIGIRTDPEGVCRLFTRFTLSSTTDQYIRIKSLELTTDGNDDDLKITKSLTQGSQITVSIYRESWGRKPHSLTVSIDCDASPAWTLFVPTGFEAWTW